MNNQGYNSTSGLCPKQAMLESYAFGKADSISARAIEEHISSCEMCSDIVEGLMLTNEQDYRNTVFRVNAKASKQSKTRKKNRGFGGPFLRVAAGLLIAITTGYLLVQLLGSDGDSVVETASTINDGQNEQVEQPNGLPADSIRPAEYSAIRDSQPVYSAQSDPPAIMDMVTIEVSEKTVEEVGLSEIEPVTKNEDIKSVAFSGSDEKIATDSEARLAYEDVALPQVNEQKESIVSVQLESIETVSRKKQSTRFSKSKAESEVERIKPAPSSASGALNSTAVYPKLHARVPLQFFKDENWQSAYDFAKDLLQLEPRNDTAAYIAAVSALRLGKQQESIDFLNRLSEFEGSTYYRAGALQRAILLLPNESEKERAIITLKSLSQGNDSIAKRAKKYLR